MSLFNGFIEGVVLVWSVCLQIEDLMFVYLEVEEFLELVKVVVQCLMEWEFVVLQVEYEIYEDEDNFVF